MSGWWSIASARSPTWLMNARAARKVRNFHVRAIVLPSLDHSGTSWRRAAISTSDKSVRRAMVGPPQRRHPAKGLGYEVLTLNKVDFPRRPDGPRGLIER